MSKCKVCTKSVYPMDPQINLDGSIFHKSCAKCEDCKCQITISNFTKYEGDGKLTLLCKTHFLKRFHEQGSYIGGDKFKVLNPRDVKPNSPSGEPVQSTTAPSVVDSPEKSLNSPVKLRSVPKKENGDVEHETGAPNRSPLYNTASLRRTESAAAREAHEGTTTADAETPATSTDAHTGSELPLPSPPAAEETVEPPKAPDHHEPAASTTAANHAVEEENAHEESTEDHREETEGV